ncbi:MAG: diaminopimelate decarboxylase [Candidatus Riflebacteria bacterium]|nr:diaminopimelate decarboxylase [Candidatus Riflebacteria bacterium]
MKPENLRTALAAAIASGAMDGENPTIVLYDLDAFRARIRELVTELPGARHALAVKANPLAALLTEARALGLGAEVASRAELEHALRIGFDRSVIVFDSPAKTVGELRRALEAGVHLNLDNLQEVERVFSILGEAGPSRGIGLRVNPTVGPGRIEETSTATAHSKFGVTLDEHRDEILQAFGRHRWLTGLHVHVGSQGCSLEQMALGVRRVLDLARSVNERAGAARIRQVDIGGGLTFRYRDSDPLYSVRDYARALERLCPELFTSGYDVITEFGRWVNAPTGVAITRVEYTKIAGGRRIAIIHVGADLFLRMVHLPDSYYHRISVFDATGAVKEGPLEVQDVAGPLCFSGDLLARERSLPRLEPGDYVVIHDVGAYTLSMWSRYNSRQAPAVYGFEELPGGPVTLKLLKPEETIDDVLRFW